jgi:hypothetical protein
METSDPIISISSPLVKLGIKWLVVMQRVTSGGIDGDLWDWSSGISLVGRTDGIGKWKDVGWRDQRMDLEEYLVA